MEAGGWARASLLDRAPAIHIRMALAGPPWACQMAPRVGAADKEITLLRFQGGDHRPERHYMRGGRTPGSRSSMLAA